jgi:hypothetical protein
MTAKAGSHDTKAVCCEKVEKVLVPAPSAVEGAVDEEQRVRVLLTRSTLIDHFKQGKNSCLNLSG